MQQPVLTKFFIEERHKLLRYIRSWFRETAELDAEDIIQTVLAKLLANPDKALPLENVSAYIYRSVKNQVIDFYRTRKAIQPLEPEATPTENLLEILQDHRPDALQDLQNQEGREFLFAALAGLTEMERRVVIANDLEGITFQEMSDTWGIALNTLLSHKARAMKKLRNQLGN